MSIISDNNYSSDKRLPPGQYLTRDFPVLSKGLTPRIDPNEWELSFSGMATRDPISLVELMTMKATEWVKDIHCVTRWSKFDSVWKGVLFDDLLSEIDISGEPDFVIAHSADGYITNIPLEDMIDGKALIAFEYDDEPITEPHGGPVRLVIPHLYFWKSAKWLTKLEFTLEDEPGFWEERGYHNYGDPWEEQRYSDLSR